MAVVITSDHAPHQASSNPINDFTSASAWSCNGLADAQLLMIVCSTGGRKSVSMRLR